MKPEHLAGLSLLLVGSPTRGFSASPAVKAWLKNRVPNSLKGVKVAAFDTRIAVSDADSRVFPVLVKLFGYAAEPIGARLTKMGGDQVTPPEGFSVKGSEGPLKDGELERAAVRARQIMARL